MATQAEVEQFRKALLDLRTLLVAALVEFWRSLGSYDLATARPAVESAVPALTSTYGELAAGIAADWFEELRDGAGARGRFSAVMADPFPVEQVRASVRWALGGLRGDSPDPERALGALTQVVDRYALGQGRNTVAENVERDPASARWARVPTGETTCAFCVLLAGRGAVYESARTAGDGNHYHGQCDCVPTPIWPDQPYPEGYDLGRYEQMYFDGRNEAKSGNPKAILAGMRKVHGLH